MADQGPTRYERFKAWYERKRLGKTNQEQLLKLIEQEYSFLFDSRGLHTAKVARASIFEHPRKQLKKQADDYPSWHEWRVPKVMVNIRFIDKYIDSLKDITLQARTGYPVLYVKGDNCGLRFCKPGNKPGGETQDEPVLYFRVCVPRNVVPPNFMPTGILDHDEATVQYLDKLRKDLQSLRYSPVESEYVWRLRVNEREVSEEQSQPCVLVEELIYALNYKSQDADSKDFIISLFSAIGALVTKTDSILYGGKKEMFKASSNFSQSLPNFWGRAFHILDIDFNPSTGEFSCPCKVRSRLPDAVLLLRSVGIIVIGLISECEGKSPNPIQESLEQMLEFSSFILADQEVVYFVVFSSSNISLSVIYRDMSSNEIKMAVVHDFQVVPMLHVDIEREFPTDDFMRFINLLLDAAYRCICRVQ